MVLLLLLSGKEGKEVQKLSLIEEMLSTGLFRPMVLEILGSRVLKRVL